MQESQDLHPTLNKVMDIINSQFCTELNVVMINAYYPSGKKILNVTNANNRHYGQQSHKDKNIYLG